MLIVSHEVSAQKEAYRQALKGFIKAGDSCVVVDDKYDLMTDQEWSTLRHIKVNGGISFQLRFDTLAGMPQKPFKAELLVDVYYWTQKNQQQPSKQSNVSLRVEFDTAKYKMIKTSDVYEVANAHRIAVVVRQVQSETFPDSLPAFFSLQNEINILRQYPFDPHAAINMTASITDERLFGTATEDDWGSGDDESSSATVQSLDGMSSTYTPPFEPHPAIACAHAADILQLSWQGTIASVPYEYDLEYAFVDYKSSYGHMFINSPSSVTQAIKEEIFRFNGTRVTLRQTSYSINLAYEKGFLLCRIRGVNYHVPNTSEPEATIRNEGDWFYNVSGTPAPTIQGWWVIAAEGGDEDPKPMEPCLNWQYNASFAEDGARKEVITFFDGKLQNRQTVTINNNDLVAVVQETILDEFGRAAASILPAPVDGINYNNKKFQYFREFNKSNLTGTSYSYQDIAYNNCGVLPGSLSTIVGASKYYSGANWFRTLTSPSTGSLIYPEATFTPNGEGYPLAVTQYTDDQTGRIRRQGGVGAKFQVGGEHDTRYFYGKPTQYELDRLFGSEAGDASHYLKNMVMDPNGQVSVSYINSTGKTIATALAGAVPSNFDALPSRPQPTTVTNTLIRPVDIRFDASTGILLGTSTFLAPLTGTYSVSYNLEELRYYVYHQLPELSQQLCHTCYYDIEISVKNSCGASLLRDQTGNPLASFVHAAGTSFNELCTTPLQNLSGTIPVYINDKADIGECNVSYKLVISKAAEDFYTTKHWENNSDLRRFESFLLQNFNEAAFKDCYTDCETCEELADGEDAFVQEMAPYIMKLITDKDAAYVEVDQNNIKVYLTGLYNDLLTHCNQIAPPGSCATNPCDERYDVMIQDVTPGGQYALYDTTSYALVDPNANVLSFYNAAGIGTYLDEAGNPDMVYNAAGMLVTPDKLSLKEFIKSFKSSWAKTLVLKHPEYCYYLWCGMNIASRKFDELIKDMPAGEAFNTHYIDRNEEEALLDKDPFFTTVNGVDGYGKRYYDAMKWELEHYSETKVFVNHTPKNILEFIDMALYCESQGFSGTCTVDNSCRKDNREWEMYVGLYLQLKQKYDEMARRCWQPECVNCYIGGDSITSIVGNLVPENCEVEYPSTTYLELLPACDNVEPCIDSSDLEFLFDYGCVTIRFMDMTPRNYDVLVHFTVCVNGVVQPMESMQIQAGTASVTECRYPDIYYSHCGYTFNIITCRNPEGNGNGRRAEGFCLPSECKDDGRYEYFKEKQRVFPDYINPCTLARLGCFQKSKYDPADGINDKVVEAIEENCKASAENLVQELINRNCSNIASKTPTEIDALKADLILVCKEGGLATNPKNGYGIREIKNPYGTSSVDPSTSIAFMSFDEVIEHHLGSGTVKDGCSSDLIGIPYPHNKQAFVLVKAQIRSASPEICQKLQNLYDTCLLTKGVPFVNDDEFYDYLYDLMGEDFDLSREDLLSLRQVCYNSRTCGFLLNEDIVLPAGLSKPDGCKNCEQLSQAEAAFAAKYTGLSTNDQQYELLYKNFMNHYFGYALGYSDYASFKAKCQRENTTYLLLCDQAAAWDEGLESYGCVKDKVDNAFILAQQAFTAYKDSVDQSFRIAYRSVCSKAKASLALTQPFQEYHYTLYYYDQAGNLVKTVPPEGVRPLSDPLVSGLVHPWENKNLGMCTKLGPVSSYIEDGSYLKDNFTLSFRLKPLTWGGYDRMLSIFSGRELNAPSYTLPERAFLNYEQSTNSFTLEVHTISDDETSMKEEVIEFATPGLVLNMWSDITISRRKGVGNEYILLLNGVPTGGTIISSTDITPSGAIMSNNIMTSTRFYSGYSEVLFRDARIYNRSLPVYEVMLNAQQPLSVANTDGLIHWLKMDDGSGNYATNSASNFPAFVEDEFGWMDDIIFQPTKHQFVTSFAYNSLNQVVKQHTPDGGISAFWYDRLGRLVISQNAEQKTPTGNDVADRYSYTKYDALGRIIEVGEKVYSSGTVNETSTRDNLWLFGYAFDYTSNFCSSEPGNTADPTCGGGWFNTGSNRQITVTRYNSTSNAADFNTNIDLTSIEVAGITSSQQNLRNRVAATFYLDEQGSTQQFASFYTYDISGNVNTLWQQLKKMKDYDGSGIKRMDYKYDLVSGKVNEVWYQKGKRDQYYYRYYYDIENRLREAWSGRSDNVLTQLKLDAGYKYYLHGPLARTEFGHVDNKLQGVDYAYTLQGWLKGINGSVLNPSKEMGRDGQIGNGAGQYIGRDVFSYVLNYFDNDYKAVNTSANSACFMSYGFSTQPAFVGRELFNGNIAAISVSLSKLNNGATTGYSYGYDQLNRLVNMRKHIDGISNNVSTTQWNSNSIEADGRYKEVYSYDANGNIQTLLRNGANSSINPLSMDALQYWYYYVNKYTGLQVYNKANMPNDNDIEYLTNRLAYVTDGVAANNYSVDVDNQTNTKNYKYDKIGNMISDEAEGITSIKWTVYGKIQQINKSKVYPQGSDNAPVTTQIDYKYDVSGNRVMKQVGNKVTFYIRDAQGNVMGVYDAIDENGYTWQEQHLYGSSRLGMYTPRTYISNGAVGNAPSTSTDLAGKRTYELSNHLGNVMVTISDKKIQMTENGYPYFVPEILSTSDYYPFGMLMPERSGYKTDGGWSAGNEEVNGNGLSQTLTVNDRDLNTPDEYKASKWIEFTDGFVSGNVDEFVAYIADGGNTAPGNTGGSGGEDNCYRYGFNGKENDDEVKGVGNQQDYGMRIYDGRLGKFLSVDPLEKDFPFYSPYHFAGLNPIQNEDLDGGEPQDFKRNWQHKSMYDIRRKEMVGPTGSYILVNDSKLGVIDVEMIYDKWSKQCWFIHQDNMGKFYYYNSNDGNHAVMTINPKTNDVKNGTFIPFATQDQIQSIYGQNLARGMAIGVFAGAFIGTALPAASFTGGPLLAINNPFTSVGAVKAIVGGTTNYAAQKTQAPEADVNYYSVLASATFGNPFVGGAVGNAYVPGEGPGSGFQAPETVAVNGLVGGFTGSLANKAGLSYPARSYMSGMQSTVRGSINLIPNYWFNVVGNTTVSASNESLQTQNSSSENKPQNEKP